MILALGLTTLISLGAVRPALAQQKPAIAVAEAGQLQELVLRDGSRAFGQVERIDAGRVFFRTAAGALLEVDIAQVVSADLAKGRVERGDYWREDSNPTRLFFGPTGRTLKRGQAYMGLYEVWMPFVQVGITDRFSIGGGTPLFFGSDYHPVWFTPKLQVVSTRETQVSIGAMHFLNIDHVSQGVAYAAITHGSTDDATTVGIGWAYEKGKGSEQSLVAMLGGEKRVSPHIKLVTENYVIDGHLLVSGGIRFLGERLSADFGLVTVPEALPLAFPMINVVWKLTR